MLERRCDLLVVSATIPTNLCAVKDLISLVRSHPQCAELKILAGGIPFNRHPELALAVGADGTAVDAAAAVDLANSLVRASEVQPRLD